MKIHEIARLGAFTAALTLMLGSLTHCGGGGAGAGAGSGGDGTGAAGPHLDLGEQYAAYCDKAYAEPCNGQTSESCKGNLDAVAASSDPGCNHILAASLACRATLTYECGQLGPEPQNPGLCPDETALATSLSACWKTSPCGQFCLQVETGKCGGPTNCHQDCVQLVNRVPTCATLVDDVTTCLDHDGVNLCGISPTCNAERGAVALCVAKEDGDVCKGMCLWEEYQGCAKSGCETDCKNNYLAKGTACEDLARAWIRCGAENGITCEGTDGHAMPVADCDPQRMALEACTGQ